VRGLGGWYLYEIVLWIHEGNLLRHTFRNRLKCHIFKSNRHGFRNRLKCHLLHSKWNHANGQTLSTFIFYGNKFRYESFNAEYHMDPNIGKATIGKERTVGVGKESLPTSCGPHRNRFLEVQAGIRVHMVSDKKNFVCRSEYIGTMQSLIPFTTVCCVH
jgi:hypothetical protein